MNFVSARKTVQKPRGRHATEAGWEYQPSKGTLQRWAVVNGPGEIEM
jgi:hypothetical protein